MDVSAWSQLMFEKAIISSSPLWRSLINFYEGERQQRGGESSFLCIAAIVLPINVLEIDYGPSSTGFSMSGHTMHLR